MRPVFPDAISRTSLLTAAARAAESCRPAALVVDPYAERLAGAEGKALLEEHPAPEWLVAALAIRTKYFDEAIASAITRGAAQVLMIAAGLDARAWRLDLPPGVRWFEVDHGPVLEHKARVLEEAAARVDRVAVPFDLRRDGLAGALSRAGFDAVAPTMVVVEGLLMYLAAEDVARLLATLAATVPAGSAFCADIPNVACVAPSGFMGTFLAWIAAKDAPWRFGTDDPGGVLGSSGWRVDGEVLFAGHPGAWPERFGRPSFVRPPPGVPVTWMALASRV